MTNRMQGVIRLHMKDRITWLATPWLVVMCSFVVNLIISLFLEEEMYTGGVGTLYVYMFVIGIITLTHTFPFATGFSIRRTDYFWGTAAAAGSASLFSALVLTLLSYVEHDLTGGWGSGLHFFHLPYLSDGSALVQLIVYFLLVLNFYYMGFVITGYFKRFGLTGLYVSVLVLLITGTIGSFLMTRQAWWIQVFGWFASHTMLEISLWTIPLTAVFMLASYVLLRRTIV